MQLGLIIMANLIIIMIHYWCITFFSTHSSKYEHPALILNCKGHSTCFSSEIGKVSGQSVVSGPLLSGCSLVITTIKGM